MSEGQIKHFIDYILAKCCCSEPLTSSQADCTTLKFLGRTWKTTGITHSVRALMIFHNVAWLGKCARFSSFTWVVFLSQGQFTGRTRKIFLVDHKGTRFLIQFLPPKGD